MDMLSDRLADIKRAKCADPKIRPENKEPTLAEIEQSHILYINSSFKPFVSVAYEYSKVGAKEGRANFGKDLTFEIPMFGEFFTDMVMHFVFDALLPAAPGGVVRCAEFLGHRFTEQTLLEFNGNRLDVYDSNVMNYHYNFSVLPNQRDAWKRCVGQEIPQAGYLYQDLATDGYKEVRFISNGYQTYKTAHRNIELWIPMLFWFNKDPRLAFPSTAVSIGARNIKLKLAAADLLFDGTAGFLTPNITVSDLYVNNIFLSPGISDMFLKKVGYTLIRVYKYQVAQCSENTGELKIDELRFPTETVYVGFRPRVNLLAANRMEDWHRYYLPNSSVIPMPIAYLNPGIPPPTYLLDVGFCTLKNAVLPTSSVNMKSNAIELYKAFPSRFTTDYVPYVFSSNIHNTPEDPGIHMLNFCFRPGEYQPSAYFNFSQSREIYIGWLSAKDSLGIDIISAATPADMVVVGIALNFIVLAQDTAVLRYNL